MSLWGIWKLMFSTRRLESDKMEDDKNNWFVGGKKLIKSAVGGLGWLQLTVMWQHVSYHAWKHVTT